MKIINSVRMNFNQHNNLKTSISGFTVATIATGGSLWFSEVLNLIPCELCWFQRILMYPMVIVFGVSILDSDFEPHKVTLILSLLGIAVSLRHSIIQRFDFGGHETCSSVGCSAIQYQTPIVELSIPNLAFLSFAMIFVISIIMYRNK